MSIFGVQGSKFTNTAETATVLIEHSVIEAQWFQPRVIEHESVINAHREFTKVASEAHCEFIVKVNLFDYALPSQKFDEIKTYNLSSVYFYPHKDRDALQDSSGNKVEFFLSIINVLYKDGTDYDVCLISFKSKDPVDLSQITTPVLAKKDGTKIVKKDGTEIKILKGATPSASI